MANLMDIQQQIAKLQQQATDLRTKEFDATVTEIKKLMAAYGITVKDLQRAPKGKAKPGRKGAVSKSPKAKKDRAAVAAKYKGPNGETWSGRGLMPKWLAALVASGQSKDSFLIEPPPAM